MVSVHHKWERETECVQMRPFCVSTDAISHRRERQLGMKEIYMITKLNMLIRFHDFKISCSWSTEITQIRFVHTSRCFSLSYRLFVAPGNELLNWDDWVLYSRKLFHLVACTEYHFFGSLSLVDSLTLSWLHAVICNLEQISLLCNVYLFYTADCYS